jgi:hypothetical protein
MTMMESAPDPLEPIFRSFEKATGWTLSRQARTILKAGLESVEVDTLGMGPIAEAKAQVGAAGNVVRLMPVFLQQLQKRAETREKTETAQKTIGGVFVLQNIGLWKQVFGCTCWPV